MKIHSIEFTKNWSRGLIWSDMINQYSHIIERTFMNDGDKIPESISENDVVLCQNVTLLKKFKEDLKQFAGWVAIITLTVRILKNSSHC